MLQRFIIVMLVVLVSLSAGQCLLGQESQPRRPATDPAQQASAVEVYATVAGVDLKAYVFRPADWQPGDRRSAIVFFFGGGWVSGTPAQFVPQCQRLAKQGMVAMTVDYRVSSRHKVTAKDCVADARQALRWLRANAERQGVDPQRIAAGGGSAGGHLAAAIALIASSESAENQTVSCVPNALVLFNPALVLDSIEGVSELPESRMQSLRKLLGTAPRDLSPYHRLHQDAPPTLVLHGTDDRVVPHASVRWYAERATQLGTQCQVVSYEGAGHGFFNPGRGQEDYFEATCQEMEAFLRSLKFLE
ncbi:MAG: alpha/beta hydrolase [Pirellulaceae bacterium]|nr:alpha/beta hydrolase [Pirellulaceae bacterium]